MGTIVPEQTADARAGRGRLLRAEICRFCLGGISTVLVCLGSMWVLVDVCGVGYFFSLNATAGVGYAYSYLVNKTLVFRRHVRSHLVYGSRFLLLQGALLLLNNGLFWFGAIWVGWHYLLVNVLIGIFLSVLNFILMKMVVFQ